MNKILSFFPFNRGIKKWYIANFLISAGVYVVILVVLSVLKSLLITVPVLGKFIYNLRGLYGLYALAGIIIGAIQCFTDIKFGRPDTLFLKKIGKFVWIGVGVICLAMLIITPRGYEKAKYTKLAKKSVKESLKSKDDDDEKSEDKDDEDEIKVDKDSQDDNKDSSDDNAASVEDASKESKDEANDADKLDEAFYEVAKGYWSDGDIVYDFTKFLMDTYVMYKSDLVDSTGNFLRVVDDSMYSVKELSDTDEGLKALVDRGNDTMEVIINGDTMQLKETSNSDFVTLKNINLTSIDELLEQDEYKALHLQAFFIDRGEKTDNIVGIGVPTYDKKRRVSYEDYFSEYPGKELVVEDYGSYIGTYVVWGIEDGIVRPILGIAGIDPDIPLLYNTNSNTLWGNDWDDNGSRYYVSYSGPQEHSVYWDENVKTEDLYLDHAEGYVEVFSNEKGGGLPFTIDESIAITGDTDAYCGEYFSGFEIKNISEDMLTVAGQNDSIRYMGILARQTQYPDGTYVYGGDIEAIAVEMGRNSFSGKFAIVLLPDGRIYIQNVSGDAFILDDYYSLD